jgi:hypothetical protein
LALGRAVVLERARSARLAAISTTAAAAPAGSARDVLSEWRVDNRDRNTDLVPRARARPGAPTAREIIALDNFDKLQDGTRVAEHSAGPEATARRGP